VRRGKSTPRGNRHPLKAKTINAMLITSLCLGQSEDIASQERRKLCQASRTTGEIARENI